MPDLDSIPFADSLDEPIPAQAHEPTDPAITTNAKPPSVHAPGDRRTFGVGLTLAILTIHASLIWLGLGGRAGIQGEYPPWRDDHPLYYHSALVTRAFLHDSWTTAGYDPAFMAGYMKSAVFPSSSTLPEVVFAAFPTCPAPLLYKIYVFLGGALAPAVFAAACGFWRASARGVGFATALFFLYLWSDFPINYVGFGMVPYFLGVPLGLFGLGAFVAYLEDGGVSRWLLAAFALAGAILVHLTTAMVVAPAALLAYAIAWRSRESGQGAKGRSRSAWLAWHVSVWLLPIVVLAANVFWWLPGLLLASTKGASDFAFVHPEGAARRILQIVVSESPMEAVLLAVGIPGLFLLARRWDARGAGLVGFVTAGFCWGYLAGSTRGLDFLQPGRHTYAFFMGIAVAAGVCLDQAMRRLLVGPWGVDRLDRWVLAGGVFLLARIVGYPLVESVRARAFAPEPFLSSRPSSRLSWVVDRVKKHVKPGERLLYEEGGFDTPDAPDPFQRGRFSGLLPERTGVEVLGGPYLHASLTTNFTQFGEGKLFGRHDWTRADFERYARIYGPEAILCHSPRARRFCRDNPDLIQIVEDDGRLMLGRVRGFEGKCMTGSATVVASPGRILVREMRPDLDGSIVLRYHSAPGLTTRPSVAWEPERHEDDPVPFIKLRPPAGTREVEIISRGAGWP